MDLGVGSSLAKNVAPFSSDRKSKRTIFLNLHFRQGWANDNLWTKSGLPLVFVLFVCFILFSWPMS